MVSYISGALCTFLCIAKPTKERLTVFRKGCHGPSSAQRSKHYQLPHSRLMIQRPSRPRIEKGRPQRRPHRNRHRPTRRFVIKPFLKLALLHPARPLPPLPDPTTPRPARQTLFAFRSPGPEPGPRGQARNRGEGASFVEVPARGRDRRFRRGRTRSREPPFPITIQSQPHNPPAHCERTRPLPSRPGPASLLPCPMPSP